MADKTNNGGHAFPFIAWQTPSGMIGVERQQGMSLRDYFAGRALSGLLAGVYSDHTKYNLTEVPVEAYAIADAMLKAREVDHG